MCLMEMGSGNRETCHGFRAGCAIALGLALSRAELSEIMMDHVGWTQRHTALFYFFNWNVNNIQRYTKQTKTKLILLTMIELQ